MNVSTATTLENKKETITTVLDNLAIEEVSNEERDDTAEDMEDWIKEFTTEPHNNELDCDIYFQTPNSFLRLLYL